MEQRPRVQVYLHDSLTVLITFSFCIYMKINEYKNKINTRKKLDKIKS